MSNREIALQLTLKMIDKGLLQFDDSLKTAEDEITEVNEFNANQIANFFNFIKRAVKPLALAMGI